jgi:hypothetical protein
MSAEVTGFDPHAPMHGSHVGPWLILERLDSGSFGVVYLARRAKGLTLYDWFGRSRTSREVLRVLAQVAGT